MITIYLWWVVLLLVSLYLWGGIIWLIVHVGLI